MRRRRATDILEGLLGSKGTRRNRPKNAGLSAGSLNWRWSEMWKGSSRWSEVQSTFAGERSKCVALYFRKWRWCRYYSSVFLKLCFGTQFLVGPTEPPAQTWVMEKYLDCHKRRGHSKIRELLPFIQFASLCLYREIKVWQYNPNPPQLGWPGGIAKML